MSEAALSGWEPSAEFLANVAAQRGAEQAELETLRKRLSTDDPDFKVIAFDLAFRVEGAPANEDYPDQVIGSSWSFGEWCLIEDDIFESENAERNARLVDAMIVEIQSALAPWIARFANMGLVRADYTFAETALGGIGGDAAATFYLVVGSAEYDDRIASLADWPIVPKNLSTIAGAWLEVSASARAINATLLHSALATEEETVGLWEGCDTLDRIPAEDESRDDWLGRVALSKEAINSILERWETVGRDPLLFDLFGSPDERQRHDDDGGWLVDFRLQRRVITSLVGATQTGKSSLAHEIASALGAVEPETPEPRTVLGQLVSGSYVVAMLNAEDDETDIEMRGRLHEARWGQSRVLQIDGSSRSLGEWLVALRALPKIDLLIVDPVRKFLAGDEDTSGVVSEFYDALRNFARETDAAVLVVHHLVKGKPRALSNVLQMVRGSGVHTERPRLAWGMIDRGNGLIEIGPIKISAVGGIEWKLNEGRFYRRDLLTSTLRPLVDQGTTTAGLANEITPRILAAVRRLNQQGAIVRRTGKRGLFEVNPPEVAGLSRAALLSAITEMLDRGDLADGTGGLVVAV